MINFAKWNKFLDDAKSERNDLKDKLEKYERKHMAMCLPMRTKITDLEHNLAEAVDGLENYGDHKMACATNTEEYSHMGCTCGLHDLIARLKA